MEAICENPQKHFRDVVSTNGNRYVATINYVQGKPSPKTQIRIVSYVQRLKNSTKALTKFDRTR